MTNVLVRNGAETDAILRTSISQTHRAETPFLQNAKSRRTIERAKCLTDSPVHRGDL